MEFSENEARHIYCAIRRAIYHWQGSGKFRALMFSADALKHGNGRRVCVSSRQRKSAHWLWTAPEAVWDITSMANSCIVYHIEFRC